MSKPNLIIDGKKLCGRCKRMVPAECFHADRRTPTGLSSWCSACARPERRAYRYANHDKVIEWEKKNRQTEHRRAKNAEYHRACKERYPERFRARALLNQAIKRGEIVRPPCEKCGAPKPHAHHHDYSKPYDVEWLCKRCHYGEHRTSPEGKAALNGEPIRPVIVGRDLSPVKRRGGAR